MAIVFELEVLKYEPEIMGDLCIGKEEEYQQFRLREPCEICVRREQDDWGNIQR